MTGTDLELLNETANRLSEEIRQSIQKYLKFTVTIGIGLVIKNLNNISESYKGAVSALDYRFVVGKNHVISINDMESKAESRQVYNRDWQKKLVSGIKTGMTKEISKLIEGAMKNLKTTYVSMDRCHIQIQQVIFLIISSLNELGIYEAEIFGESFTPFTEIYGFKTLDQVEEWLKELCNKICLYISGRRNDFCKVQALKAEEYIRVNYQNPEISLSSICKHLLLSTSYFSIIFKNFTGETFIEYLTKVRVEKAMELIRTTSLKTYEISEKVGYLDPHYFSLIFKKATGLTTTEYREKD